MKMLIWVVEAIREVAVFGAVLRGAVVVANTASCVNVQTAVSRVAFRLRSPSAI